MICVRLLCGTFYLVLASMLFNYHLNAMEPIEKSHYLATCHACSMPYTKTTDSCNHNLCPLCFVHNDVPLEILEVMYHAHLNFKCENCSQWVSVGTRKSLPVDSDGDWIERLWVSMSNSEDLFRTIKSLALKRPIEQAAALLKQALAGRNKSLRQIIDVFGYTVLHAACNLRLETHSWTVQCVKIILGAAGPDAWNLVCKQTSAGDNAIVIAISYSMNYKNDLDVIYDLFAVAPNDKERWKLISSDYYDSFLCKKLSLLNYVHECKNQFAYNTYDGFRSGRLYVEHVKLLESYKPKDQ